MGKKEKYIEHANDVWKDFEDAKEYQSIEQLPSKFKENRNFYNGIQWAKPTKNTMHLPRPVFNICELIVENKVSNVLGSPVKLNFIGENHQDTSMFTRFAEYQQKEMGQEALDEKACEDGAILGTYVYHYYWDGEAKGRRGNYEGALRGQIIDPINLLVANPRDDDIQNQEWIILVSREMVKNVKDMADEDVDKSLITADEEPSANEYNYEEQNDSDLCTLLTRYFRKDGEVYFEKIVKGTAIHKPRALNPTINEQELIRKEKEDLNVEESPDTEIVENDNFDDFKASLYPIEVGQWKSKNNSIYGRGEVEGIIPNQKAINFEYAMELLNHQELGWGKILVKPSALKGQVIDNTPGQVITDYSTGNNWGITRMEGAGLTAAATQLIPSMVDLTRSCTNSAEVLTGEVLSKDMSGVAISQLQAQAQKPIAKIQRRFWRSKERIGKILEQFYRLFYEDTYFTYDLTLDELGEKEEENRRNGGNAKVQRTQAAKFNGKDYDGKYFSVVVEAGAGTKYSEIMAMDTLNTLFMNGGINNMSTEQLEQFIALYPDSAMPYKAELRAIIRKQQNSELGQLKQVSQAQAQQIEQYKNYVASQEETITQLNTQVQQLENLLQQQKADYENKHKKQSALLGQLFADRVNQVQQENPKKVVETKKDNNSEE